MWEIGWRGAKDPRDAKGIACASGEPLEIKQGGCQKEIDQFLVGGPAENRFWRA